MYESAAYGLVRDRRARSTRPRQYARLAVLSLFVLPWAFARADITKADVQVAARALSFVSTPLRGNVRVGIVYSARSPRSAQQAQGLRTMLASGLRVGTVDLKPVMVEVGDAATADVDLFFMTEHIPATDTPNLLGPGSRAKRLCITTDIEQVRKGTCVMGVRSQPKVEVFVNRAAATTNDISFATMFRVMITELG